MTKNSGRSEDRVEVRGEVRGSWGRQRRGKWTEKDTEHSGEHREHSKGQ